MARGALTLPLRGCPSPRTAWERDLGASRGYWSRASGSRAGASLATPDGRSRPCRRAVRGGGPGAVAAPDL